MNEPAIPLASAVQDLVRAAASRAFSHPAPEDLAVYAEGELEPQAEENIRSHLAVCQECATTVLDLAHFPRVEERARPADRDRAASPLPDWTTLRHRLAAEGILGTASAGEHIRARHLRAPDRYLRWALAASLAASLGMGLWVFTLKRQAAELSRPEINMAYAELLPVDELRLRNLEAAPAVFLPRQASSLLLILSIGDREHFAEYRVEVSVLDEGGVKSEWSHAGLLPTRFGSFTLELRRERIRPGRYHLQLFGRSGSGEKLLAQYQFSLVVE